MRTTQPRSLTAHFFARVALPPTDAAPRNRRRPTVQRSPASQRRAGTACASSGCPSRSDDSNQSDRHRLQHRQRAAAVVGIAVAHHHAVQRAHADCAQIRHDDAVAAVDLRAERRAGVIEQRVVAGLRHDREPLPDIEHGEPAVRHPPVAAARPETTAATHRADPARGETARQQQPQHARHRRRPPPTAAARAAAIPRPAARSSIRAERRTPPSPHARTAIPDRTASRRRST